MVSLLYNRLRPHLQLPCSASQILFALLGLLLLMLPVSYKAGTSTSHPHAVFVVIWDDLRGTTHTHTGNSSRTTVEPTTGSALLSLEIPLSAVTAPDIPRANLAAARTTAASELLVVEDDVPQITGLRVSAEYAGLLAALASLLLVLLHQNLIRTIWTRVESAFGLAIQVPNPPPQSL